MNPKLETVFNDVLWRCGGAALVHARYQALSKLYSRWLDHNQHLEVRRNAEHLC
jgi:hypothetical protein